MVRPAKLNDSGQIASIHLSTLTNSFLASLGLKFLINLYQFLIFKEKVWVYEEDQNIKGFISYSRNSAGMMKRFLINCPKCLLLLAIKIFTHPNILIKLFETFQSPYNSKKITDSQNSFSLPKGELLSIAITPNCQASGIGSRLLLSLEDYLKQNSITKYKVIAGNKLIGANKFYQKNGFELTAQITIHGNDISNVYLKNIV